MRCPYCLNAGTKVVDKRDAADATRRRRECISCKKRFTTYERVEKIAITVIKKDGTREAFDREKIYSGIRKSCEKRPVTKEEMEKVVQRIEKQIKKLKEVQSRKIGQLVLKYLKALDKVAYLRFASVYREWGDVAEFQEEVEKLSK